MGINEEFVQLRRQIIGAEFVHLNEAQKKAVLKTEGPVLLLAGAGSGKTTVIINRIQNILKYGSGSDSTHVPSGVTEDYLNAMRDYIKDPKEEDRQFVESLCRVGVPRPYEVLAITFTNKAAGELKHRLESVIGETAADVWAHTFHSACLRILRRDIEKLGYSKSFTIYDEDDKKKIITETIKTLNLDEKRFDIKGVVGEISRAKDKFENAEEYAANTGEDFYKQQVARIFDAYQNRMRQANALDFDDIIIKAVELLYDFPEVLEYYQSKFKYVLVDEYQDTNHAQYLLCSLLAGGQKNLCVVGDDDQSIYKFRGATIKNILDFEKQYKNALTIRLEQNYRSTSNILSAANEVIAQNTQRKGKTLWTDNIGGDKIKLYYGESQEDEAQYIAKEILKGFKNGDKLSDFTVLYRSHVLSNPIENAFKRNGIQYRIVSGLRFFDRAEVKDMLAYLWIINNTSDEVRLKRIINVPPRKIGGRTLELVEQVATENGISQYDACKRAQQFPELSKSAMQLAVFVNMIEDFKVAQYEKTIEELYDMVLKKTGYMDMLLMQSEKDGKARLENVLELKSNILEYSTRTETPTLGGFLEEIALFTDLDRYDTEADAVTMMTMHSAKGLEFNVVFICGAEDGIFPSHRSVDSAQELEEERRLCYVAMTRAKKTLHITGAKRRVIYGQTTYSKKSRFIDEIPEELIETIETSVLPPIRVKQQAEVRLTPRTSFVTKAADTGDFVSEFNKDDTVAHNAFGEGVVLKKTPIRGDMLLEIMFDTAGKKMMMEKTAAQYMKKI